MAVPREVLGDPWGSLGSSLGVLEGPWGDPREHKKRRLFSRSVLGRSWEALWVFLGYWAIIGSVLRRQNVVISLVLGGFLRCHVFSCFFVNI